jgi:hypothetical protein
LADADILNGKSELGGEMSYQRSTLKRRKSIYLLAISILIVALCGNVYSYNLTVDVADMGAYPGDLIEIPIYMTNAVDTVHAFELWLILDRPDLIQFNEDPDPKVELSGTLCASHWGVAANSVGGTPYNLKISASADVYEPGILPQDGNLPLIKILAQVYDIPDSFPDRVVQIYIQRDNLDNFSFSDPHGKGIGIITDSIIDSNCYHCEIWQGEICLSWIEVDCDNPQYPIDSTWCCDTILVGTLDTSYVHVEDGQVEVSYCGDFNSDGGTNLLDIVELINCIYSDIPPESCIEFDLLDANCDGGTNILDIVYYIAYLYQNGPPVECCGQ